MYLMLHTLGMVSSIPIRMIIRERSTHGSGSSPSDSVISLITALTLGRDVQTTASILLKTIANDRTNVMKERALPASVTSQLRKAMKDSSP